MKKSCLRYLVLFFVSLSFSFAGQVFGEKGESRASGAPPPKIKPPDFVPDRNSTGPRDWFEKWKELEEKLIPQQEKKNQEANATIAGQKKRIEDKRGELAARQSALAKSRARLAECEKLCDAMRTELQRKKAELTQKVKVAQQLNADLLELQAKIKTIEAEIAKIEEDVVLAEKKAKIPHTTDWHYLDDHGWLWTSPEHYPLVFSEQSGGWLFYQQGTKEPWLYYDYQQKAWVKWF